MTINIQILRNGSNNLNHNELQNEGDLQKKGKAEGSQRENEEDQFVVTPDYIQQSNLY